MFSEDNEALEMIETFLKGFDTIVAVQSTTNSIVAKSKSITLIPTARMNSYTDEETGRIIYQRLDELIQSFGSVMVRAVEVNFDWRTMKNENHKKKTIVDEEEEATTTIADIVLVR
jgi:hypothetical protein